MHSVLPYLANSSVLQQAADRAAQSQGALDMQAVLQAVLLLGEALATEQRVGNPCSVDRTLRCCDAIAWGLLLWPVPCPAVLTTTYVG